MHRFMLFPLLAMAILCLAQEQTYTDRFDSFNIDQIIANKRLLGAYIKCVLDQGRCTPEGKELKLHVTDAMQTACKKCTEKQKEGARKIVNHIRENDSESWNLLVAKYDPNGEFKPVYEPFLAGENPAPSNQTETIGDSKTDLGGEKKADLVEARKTESVEFKKTESVGDKRPDLFGEDKHDLLNEHRHK